MRGEYNKKLQESEHVKEEYINKKLKFFFANF